MKIWQKICIYSIFLFLIIFNIAGFILIENSHNLSLKREIERGLSEHLSIYSGMQVSMYSVKDLFKQSNRFSGGIIYSLLRDYLYSFNNKDAYIEILNENNDIIFTNSKFNFKKDGEEFKNLFVDKRKYVIRDVHNKTFLFATNLLKVDDKSFKFSYIRDITYVYEDRKKAYTFFIKIDIMVSLILAIGMYILSKIITKPINTLIDSTKSIAGGNFSQRMLLNSNDEIGILAKNFDEMTDKIEEKINELKKNSQQKQRFIDNLTHEIKTPLTSIIGYSDLLRFTRYNEEIFSKGLNHIFREGKRLESLSFKMMKLTMLKKEEFKMKKENIKEILYEIKYSLDIKLNNKNIDLIILGENCELLVEKDLIKILILNLIDNAIKASCYNSKIYLNTYKNKNIVIEVKDEGIGISKEEIENIFDPFYMVDKSRSKNNNGFGLGLSICREIADIHKANLKVDSELKKGTSVKVIFE